MPTPQTNQNTSPPEFLDHAPRSPEELIAMGAEIMADFLDPASGLSERDALNKLVELFDNPTAIEAYEREMQRRRGGRDVDNWH